MIMKKIQIQTLIFFMCAFSSSFSSALKKDLVWYITYGNLKEVEQNVEENKGKGFNLYPYWLLAQKIQDAHFNEWMARDRRILCARILTVACMAWGYWRTKPRYIKYVSYMLGIACASCSLIETYLLKYKTLRLWYRAHWISDFLQEKYRNQLKLSGNR